MESRLDSLFSLLSKDISPAARRIAAQKIGEVQASHPRFLQNMLERTHAYLQNKLWDTRVAAKLAIGAIVSHVAPWAPPDDVDDADDGHSEDFRYALATFSFDRLIASGKRLLGTSGSEYDRGLVALGPAEILAQRREIEALLGADASIASYLADEDLRSAPGIAADADAGAIDVEQDLRRGQRLRRRRHDDLAQRQRRRVGDAVTPPVDADATWARPPELEWPLNRFADELSLELFDHRWHVRHGAALGLQAILGAHLRSVGCARRPAACAPSPCWPWLEDLAVRVLCILVLDRFEDYAYDKPVSPVREACVEVLGALLAVAPLNALADVVRVATAFACDRESWQVRHSAYLVLTQVGRSRPDALADAALGPQIRAQVLDGLREDHVDVQGAAAAALTLVLRRARGGAVDFAAVLSAIDASVWGALGDPDNVAGAISHNLELLVEVCNLVATDPALAATVLPLLGARLPHVLPFFRHMLRSVRLAALRVVARVVRATAIGEGTWLAEPPHFEAVLRVTFQNLIVELEPAVLAATHDLWAALLEAAAAAPPGPSPGQPPSLLNAALGLPQLISWLHLACQAPGTAISTDGWIGFAQPADGGPPAPVSLKPRTSAVDRADFSLELQFKLAAAFARIWRTAEARGECELAARIVYLLRVMLQGRAAGEIWMAALVLHDGVGVPGSAAEMASLLLGHLARPLGDLATLYTELDDVCAAIARDTHDLLAQPMLVVDDRAAPPPASVTPDFARGVLASVLQAVGAATDPDAPPVAAIRARCSRLLVAVEYAQERAARLRVIVVAAAAAAIVAGGQLPDAVTAVVRGLRPAVTAEPVAPLRHLAAVALARLQVEHAATRHNACRKVFAALAHDLDAVFPELEEVVRARDALRDAAAAPRPDTPAQTTATTTTIKLLGLAAHFDALAALAGPRLDALLPWVPDAVSDGLRAGASGAHLGIAVLAMLLPKLVLHVSAATWPQHGDCEENAMEMSALGLQHDVEAPTFGSQVSRSQTFEKGSIQGSQVSSTQPLEESNWRPQISSTQPLEKESIRGSQIPSSQTLEKESTRGSQIPSTQPPENDSTRESQIPTTIPSTQPPENDSTRRPQIPSTQPPENETTTFPDANVLFPPNLLARATANTWAVRTSLIEGLVTSLADPDLQAASAVAMARLIAAGRPDTILSVMMERLTPLIADPARPVSLRRGAALALFETVANMELALLDAAAILAPVLLRCTSDRDDCIRRIVSLTFARVLRLVALQGDGGGESSAPAAAAAVLTDPVAARLAALNAQNRDFFEQLLGTRPIAPTRLRPPPQDVRLRPYQVDGIAWLDFLRRYHLHGILADDMGLGKTLQTLAILAQEHAEAGGAGLPSLVVCPVILIDHWEHELRRHYPGGHPIAHVRKVVGLAPARGAAVATIGPGDLVLTSYEVLKRDVDRLAAIEYAYVVLDEGHMIRNASSRVTAAAKRLNAVHRLILTGTPIQNNVLELWALFDFLMPGFLHTHAHFQAHVARPVQAAADPRASDEVQDAGLRTLDALHRILLPFILRRLKEHVLQDLPKKTVQDVLVDPTPLQTWLLGEAPAPRGNFQNLQYLQRVTTHPRLVIDHIPEACPARAALPADVTHLDHAPKLRALKQLIDMSCGGGDRGGDGEPAAVASKNRLLVFAQRRETLALIETDVLARLPGLCHLRLDGSVAIPERTAIITRFNSDPSVDLLLLTVAVGGLGLNLTAANVVIFVEHDWNPQNDLQAMERAHRLGQRRAVNVYRIITRDTLEERIMNLQQFKINVANKIVGEDNTAASHLRAAVGSALQGRHGAAGTDPQATPSHDGGDTAAAHLQAASDDALRGLQGELGALGDADDHDGESADDDGGSAYA